MAYPLAVSERPLRAPPFGDTNIAAQTTPPIDELFDYFPVWSAHLGAVLRILNTSATPWWTSTDQSLDIGAPFTSGFSSGFRGNA